MTVVQRLPGRFSGLIDTEANWAARNPLIYGGETVFSEQLDGSLEFKVGTGTALDATHYLDLNFGIAGPPGGTGPMGPGADASALTVATSNITLSGTQTVGGVAVPANKVVLAVAQSTGKDDGLWVCHSGAWTRPSNYATGSDATGFFVYVEDGDNKGAIYGVQGAGPYIVDTDATTWGKTAGSGVPDGSLDGKALGWSTGSGFVDAAPVIDAAITALGLGTAATHDASDFDAAGAADAVAATLADVATSGDYSDLTGTPSLGTAASHATTDFDAAGAASTAQSNAESYTDTQITALDLGTVSQTDYPGSSTGKFLKDDGTFDTPTGGGGASDAADVTFDPTGLDVITGTDVQAALEEVDAAFAGFQPVDSDLTAIAGLDSSTAGAIASDGSGWIKKTYAQLKTALSLGVADVSGAASLASPTFTGTPKAPTQSAGDNSTNLATTAYVDGLLDASNAMQFKGVIDCSTNPNYPAASAGWTYKVSVAGKIGGSSGVNVEVDDSMYCLVDGTASGNQATVGSAWAIIQTNIDGAVVGPASSTASDFVTFSGTTGKVVQDSGVSLDTDGTLAANSDSRIASQKAVATALAAKAPLASPTFTGHPVGVTETAGNNSTRLASTAYADGAVATETSRAQTREATLSTLNVAFCMPGTATVRDGAGAWVAPYACTITGFRAVVDSGSTTVVKLKQNGTLIGSASSGLTTSVAATTFTGVSVAAGDVIRLSITTAGSGVNVQVSLEGTVS